MTEQTKRRLRDGETLHVPFMMMDAAPGGNADAPRSVRDFAHQILGDNRDFGTLGDEAVKAQTVTEMTLKGYASGFKPQENLLRNTR